MDNSTNTLHAAPAKVTEVRTRSDRHRGAGRDHPTTSLGAAGPARATLQRLQSLADSSPRVAQLQRLRSLANSVSQRLVQRQFPQEVELPQGRFDVAQRKTPEEDELLQGRFAVAQRKTPEEEELLQGQFASSPAVSQLQAHATAPAALPNHTGLPDGLKSGIEALSGMAMDDVRVHYNSDKPAQLNAHAYARGSDIHLAPGQDRHLPHEAWHLVQQAQGRVQPTLQLSDGIAVNDDPSLEREADQMGERALASGG
jgi:hypothetical protein